MHDISDRQFLDLSRFVQALPEYRRKELAIITISSTLEPGSVESVVKTMVALSELEEEELNKQYEWQSRQDEENAITK